MKPQDLGSLIKEIVTMNREASTNTQIEIFLDNADKNVICDAQQVRQAFTNILKNAIDSVDEKRQTEDPDYKGHVTVGLFRSPSTGRLVISVSDNGLGLPKDRDPQSLTEPYVTLREKGTGLGLAIVKKIMEDHGGHIIFGRIESPEIGLPVLTGATVSLMFPEKQDQVHEILDSTLNSSAA